MPGAESGDKIAIWLPSFTPSANGTDSLAERQSSFGSQERINKLQVNARDNSSLVMSKIRSDVSDNSSVLSYQQQYALHNPQMMQQPH